MRKSNIDANQKKEIWFRSGRVEIFTFEVFDGLTIRQDLGNRLHEELKLRKSCLNFSLSVITKKYNVSVFFGSPAVAKRNSTGVKECPKCLILPRYLPGCCRA
jgi:hypothetical protein